MREWVRSWVVVPILVSVMAGCLSQQPRASEEGPGDASELPLYEPHVVVATLDTGGNLFHPTWTRNETRHPSLYIPGYPPAAASLNLTVTDDFVESVKMSVPELEKLIAGMHPYWVQGTNIIGTWAHETDQEPVFDIENGLAGEPGSNSHGSQASSQIAGLDYSIAPEAFIVIMDRTNQGATSPSVYGSNAAGLRWAADQPWIDIIHTNIQNPVPLANKHTGQIPAPFADGYPEAVFYALSKGKIVVSAGGNFWAEATETSPHAGPRGVLVAGANDNCGYTDFSNPNPHVVMDGYQTVSAAPMGFGDGTFGGTSSASPRISGYVAQLLLEIRRAFNYTGGIEDGALVVLEEGQAPSSGPLADGTLTGPELLDVVRKTANPNPHASKFDGGTGICIPQPVDLPAAFYPKMGYGEVSEHTIGAALAVSLGQQPMPARPAEDAYFLLSDTLRQVAWETLP